MNYISERSHPSVGRMERNTENNDKQMKDRKKWEKKKTKKIDAWVNVLN